MKILWNDWDFRHPYINGSFEFCLSKDKLCKTVVSFCEEVMKFSVSQFALHCSNFSFLVRWFWAANFDFSR